MGVPLEANYGGSTEEIRRYCLFGAQASGPTDPRELSYHVMRGAGRS